MAGETSNDRCGHTIKRRNGQTRRTSAETLHYFDETFHEATVPGLVRIALN